MNIKLKKILKKEGKDNGRFCDKDVSNICSWGSSSVYI